MPKTSYCSSPPARPRQVGRGVRYQWVLANTLSLTVSFLIFQIVSDVTTVVLGGLLLGVSQWLVLRKYFLGRFRAIWWVIATLVGWIGSICILGVIFVFGILGPAILEIPTTNNPYAEPIISRLDQFMRILLMLGPGGFIGGLITGFLQYLVVRKRISYAGDWIPVAASGQMLGIMIPSLLLLNDRWSSIAVSSDVQGATARIAIGAVIGSVYGLITGGKMIQLLRRPINNELDRSPEV